MPTNLAIPTSALVTGASGFLGKNLVAFLLQHDCKVSVIVRVGSSIASIPAGATIIRHDGSTMDLLRIVKAESPEVIFHLASCFLAKHQSEDIDRLVDSNLKFGLQLLEAAVQGGCKTFVNAGTAWQHYNNQSYDPVCLYAATKQAYECLIDYYVKVHGLHAVTVKLHDTYGEGDERGKLFYLLMNAAASGEALGLSPGEQKIDLVHAEDVCRAFVAAYAHAEKSPTAFHDRFMISSGAALSIKELVSRMSAVLNVPIACRWGERPYRDREVMIPATLEPIVPEWQPMISLEQGIQRVWAQRTAASREM